MTTNSQLASQVSDSLRRWNDQLDQLAGWLVGDPAGGPNLDGRYPLTAAAGSTELHLSLPAVVDLVAGPAATARQARDSAVAAEASAGAHLADAELAKNAAGISRTAAETLRTETQNLRNDVAARWAAVQGWHSAVSADRTAVEEARAEALQARDDIAEDVGRSEEARMGAEAARDEAAGHASSIDPSQFAPADHGHAVADVAGLQAALAAKADGGHLHDDRYVRLNTDIDLHLKEVRVGGFGGAFGVAFAGGVGDARFNQNETSALIACTQSSVLGFGSLVLRPRTNSTGASIQLRSRSELRLKTTDAGVELFGMVKAGGRSLLDEIDAKAALGHKHVLADITGLQAALDTRIAFTDAPVLAAEWKFDSGTLSGVNTASSPPLQAFASNDGPAFMSFHRGFNYAVNMGLDTDNVFRIGGWSAPPDVLTLTMKGVLRASGSIHAAGRDLLAEIDAKQPVGSYAPSGHIHSIADVSGLRAKLDGKANASHDHSTADILGLQAALDGKQAAGSYAPAAHSHSVGSIFGLSSELAAKASLTGRNIVTNTWNFDSSGLSGVNTSVNPPLQAFSSGSAPAMMSFHRNGAFAVNMGLDADNVFRIGGWSAPADVLTLTMSGNLFMAGQIRAAGGRVLRLAEGAYPGGDVTVSSASPSGGSDGDIWLQV